MGSRMLLSFPFLLAGMLALSSVAVAQSSINCVLLDPEKDHLQQMVDCRGDTFDFKNNENKKNGFKLSGLDQDTADKIFYQLDLDGKLDKNRPRKFDADITIENSFMETLAMAFEPGRNHKAVIRNNKLVDFRIRPDPKKTTSVELEVRGNKQLSMGSIYKLSKVPRLDLTASKIQHFQECFFDSKPLGSLAELEGCSGVEGDLVIDSSTNTANIPSTLRIAEIRDGCLRVEKSKLTNLKFLEGLLDSRPPKTCSDPSQNRYIKENTQLCLTSEEQIRWENYKLTYVGTCDDRCSADFATTNPTKPCQIVTGDVKITGNVDLTKLEHWDRVTVLEGTLEVDNTDLAEIEIFKKLKEIKNPSKFKRALTVTRNSKMEKFNLPKLKSITQQPDAWQGPVLFHQNNPAFKLSWPEYQKWLNITSEKLLHIPHVDPPIVLTTQSPLVPTTPSPQQIRDQNKINAEANKQTYTLATVVGCIIIPLPVIIIIAIVASIYCCCLKEKANNKKREDHKDTVVKKPVDKNPDDKMPEVGQLAPPMATTEHEKLSKTLYEEEKKVVLRNFESSYKERDYAKACQMAREADEMTFKMSDMITNVNAEELDFKRVPPPTSEEKTSPKCYRFEQKSQWLAYNPRHIKSQPTKRMEKFDPHAVLKVLLTNCNEFFVTNYHLMADTIKYLSGPYYGGQSKNLLGKIDGPVTLATDIHSMLETLQVILNIDFDEKNDNKQKVHPAFRQKYVFLGNYVDNGDFGLECSVLVCLLARLFPGNFVILRGYNDQDIRKLVFNKEKRKNTIDKWGDALRADEKLENPHHFADCMYLDYVEKVVAHMPYACLINGKIFACHGGMALSMLRMTGTLDELFGKVHVPYIENVSFKTDVYYRYFPSPDPHNTPDAECHSLDNCVGYFKYTNDDEYTTRLGKHKKRAQVFMEGKVLPNNFMPTTIGYREYRSNEIIPEEKRNPEFEIQHKWLYELMSSQQGTCLTSCGNEWGAGNLYSYENVTEFCERFGLDYIVRGNQMKFGVSPDGKVVNIYSNPYHVLHQKCQHADPRKYKPEPMGPDKFASVVRINPDGTRKFVFIRLSWEKDRKQALLKTNWTIRRELGERKTKMEKRRRKELKENLGESWVEQEEDEEEKQQKQETKKTDRSNANQQNTGKSTPEKNSETGKKSKKSGEKSTAKSTPSGEERKTPKSRQTSNKMSNK